MCPTCRRVVAARLCNLCESGVFQGEQHGHRTPINLTIFLPARKNEHVGTNYIMNSNLAIGFPRHSGCAFQGIPDKVNR